MANKNSKKDFNFNAPMNTLKEIPSPNENAQSITAVVREGGRITGYQLSDGQVIDKSQGVQMAKNGNIEGVGIASRNGNDYLKSLPDGESKNLSDLPTADN